MVSGVLAVLTRQLLRSVRLTAVDRLQDGLVLVPHGMAQARSLEHRPHGTADMPPVIIDGCSNEWITRGGVDHVVKLHIGVNHRPDTLSGGSDTPGSEHR